MASPAKQMYHPATGGQQPPPRSGGDGAKFNPNVSIEPSQPSGVPKQQTAQQYPTTSTVYTGAPISAVPTSPIPQSKQQPKKGGDGDDMDDLSRWELDLSEIQMGKKLGSGAFGTVFKGTLRGKEVAVKKLTATNFDEETLHNFRSEVAILSKLRHPNVLLFMGAVCQPGNLIIVTEFMDRGSVYDLLRDKSINPPLTFKMKMKWAKEAALGMNWLHRSNPVMIHRDLKTSNLLVDKNWMVKVSDFGLSHIKKKQGANQKGSYGAIGTPLWMAPEVLLNKEYDESADLYSFGIVLWELLTGEDPFPNIDTYSAMLDQVCIANQRPPIPQNCPKTLRQLITDCWNAIPDKRPTFQRLIDNHIFEEVIMEAAIGDRIGREMWKRYFNTKEGLKETVSWRDFIMALWGHFNKPLPRDTTDPRFLCLKTLLEKGDVVTIEEWSKLLEWFGPMESLDQLLGKIYDLLSKPWFHGYMSSEQAEKALKKHRKGFFLVRFSASDPGAFAITSLAKDGKLKHYKILHKPGLSYLIGKIEAASLEDIVTKYKKDLYLKHPCPGWPYEELFSGLKTTTSETPSYDEPTLDAKHK